MNQDKPIPRNCHSTTKFKDLRKEEEASPFLVENSSCLLSEKWSVQSLSVSHSHHTPLNAAHCPAHLHAPTHPSVRPSILRPTFFFDVVVLVLTVETLKPVNFGECARVRFLNALQLPISTFICKCLFFRVPRLSLSLHPD